MKRISRCVATVMGVLLCLFVFQPATSGDLAYPGTLPDTAILEMTDTGATLKNNLLEAVYHWDEAGLSTHFKNMREGRTGAESTSPFALELEGGRVLGAADFEMCGGVTSEQVTAQPRARRLAERFKGWRLRMPFYNRSEGVDLVFAVTLRDGSNYVTQEVTITPRDHDLHVEAITLLDLEVEHAALAGDTQGAPVVAASMFFAYESPISESVVEPGRVRCFTRRGTTLKIGETLRQSCVMGVVPIGQTRRGFLYYLEQERAHPYRPFLHYNSWYDIAWGDRKFNEEQALAAIAGFGEELTVKRGVVLQSFVFDDGWDDNSTLWGFHDGFPNGFAPLRGKAAHYHSSVGTWLSPFGGYGEVREQRLAFGREQGYEINASGFSMAGPRYYARFKAICAEMIRDYGVNFFKFDGMGAGLGAGARGSQNYLNDVEALLKLTHELREIAPDLYISATTGTWPSPYFLWHADNIWRGSNDMGFSGQGSKRQQWINYRDTWTYRNIVQKGPLYPLNALMTQGIVQAHHGMAAELGNDVPEMADEIWSFFGSGTSLQELYIAPDLLTPVQWDVLAQAASWARANAEILVDTHWVGGDPGENQPYGWASWSPGKAILVLRNPAEQPGTITVEAGAALELPEDAPERFRVTSPRPNQRPVPVAFLKAGEPYCFELAPFEVLVFELLPEV